MPLAPQHEWEEDHDTVVVRVRCAGCVARTTSIELASAFAKVNVPPSHVLAIDLKGEIDADASKAVFGEDGETGALTLYLRKAVSGEEWAALRATGDKV